MNSNAGARSRRWLTKFRAVSLAVWVLGVAWPACARADIVMRHAADASRWPTGSEVIPFELRDGLILLHATLVSPSGHDTTGLLIADTGAPALAVKQSAFRALAVDTVSVSYGVVQQVHRTLESLDLGGVSAGHVDLRYVIPDSILDADVLGFFAPSYFADRAVVIDYERRELVLVRRSLSVVSADTSAASRHEPARAHSSRGRYAAVLSPSAVPVPFRLFEGGRMLVDASIEDPEPKTHSLPLTLLLDTGASACALFEDVMNERVHPSPHWPRQYDMRVRTVLGAFHEDGIVVPRLVLPRASLAISQNFVLACVTSRTTLPDIQGELPDPVHGLLGSTFLRQYRLVIDYANEVVWFEPRGATIPSGAAGHSPQSGKH